MDNKNKLLALLTIGILLPSFYLVQTSQAAGPPNSVEGLKQTLWNAVKFFPETIKKVGGDVISWLKGIWNSYIYPFLHKIWLKIEAIFGKEIEDRTPVVKEEFKKETQEMKQDLPQLIKSAWEKVKDFFKFK